MSVTGKDIDRAWNKLGMEISNTGDRHAIFRVDGKLILRTKRSFGTRKLDGNIPSLIRQQMKLNEAQFSNLIACPLTREGYIAILQEKGFVEKPVPN